MARVVMCKRSDRGCSSTNLEDKTLPSEAKVGLLMLYCSDCGSFQNHQENRQLWEELHPVIHPIEEETPSV